MHRKGGLSDNGGTAGMVNGCETNSGFRGKLLRSRSPCQQNPKGSALS